ncbi:MAG TPA: hypothetical protein ENI94_14435 [Gammaproteobacteria bacterium]|nr:hypothetical protein [Gammaproteobacteria bacterium]
MMIVLSVGGELANPNETNNVGFPASPPTYNKQDVRLNLMTLGCHAGYSLPAVSVWISSLFCASNPGQHLN